MVVLLVVKFSINNNQPTVTLPEAQAQILDREEVVNIESGMTFSTITEQVGLEDSLMHELLEASQDEYDLSTVRVGKPIKFYFDRQTGEFKKLVYQIDSEEELFIEKNGADLWQAECKQIDYEVRLKTISGTIDSSLYQSAVEQNVDIRAIIALADVFAWTVDFGMGIRVGDTYKFIFE